MNRDWAVRLSETVIQNREALLRWHYETGCVLKALAQVGLQTGTESYFTFIGEIGDALVDPEGRIKGYTIEEYNLDQINAGKILFLLLQRTGAVKYRRAIDLLLTQLKGQPRNSLGGYWHKKIYPYQMWLDGVYMAAPFLAEYARTFNEPRFFDDAAQQILLIEKHTRDPVIGLLYHAWDESGEQRWADPETGCSPHFWGRAMGWFAMALIDVLDYLPLDHGRRGEIVGILHRMMKALTSFQDRDSGLWYQVLDQGGRAGNYPEASASAMFVYALLKGVRLHYLEERFAEPGRRGYEGIVTHLVKTAEKGSPELTNICGVAGLGGDPYRDGSYEYYVQEPKRVNDPKGVAPLIMASLEYETGV